ncbi:MULTISPECIES: peptide deformylase [Clostridium]|uniref:peptide deformylase n=1 Tax=Clostridium TaxID=1485 RepID=UPI0008256670|nr:MULTISPECIES: peptide deformylase [Clostridium]PJI09244.1 peptide deformylase [Clostridium sp. CT7]
MALRQIRLLGDDILRKKSRDVEVVDDKIRQILQDMLDTLHNTDNGAAIAAPQIGILKKLVVIDAHDTVLKLVNPKIVKKEGSQEVVEGCLSIPNKFGKLTRPEKVTVEALNENGKKITITGTGFLAKCLCHEIDHLYGILFIDFVTEYVK